MLDRGDHIAGGFDHQVDVTVSDDGFEAIGQKSGAFLQRLVQRGENAVAGHGCLLLDSVTKAIETIGQTHAETE